MKIVEYDARYKEDFINLNMAWIHQFFTPEPGDEETMRDIDKAIEDGAMIYFALEDETVIATCMARPTVNKDEWEINKLATDPNYQGRGAGKACFKACMDYAIANKAKNLILISNRILKPALTIYDKFGFKEVEMSPEHSGYERADIQLELKV